MTMDAVTEKISHFIGAFEMILEETRMRAEYDKFRAAEITEEEAKSLELKSLQIKHNYKMDNYEPGLKTDLPPFEPSSPWPDAEPSEIVPFVAVGNAAFTDDNVVGAAQGSGLDSIPITTITLNYEISPPSAVLHVTHQLNALRDNDVFSQIVDFSAETVATLSATLDTIVDFAASLAPIQIDVLPTSGNWMQTVKEIQESSAAFSVASLTPLLSSVFQGEEANGIFVNGAVAEDLIGLNDQLPLFFANKIAKAKAAEEADHDFGQDFTRNPHAPEDIEGTTVVAGANTISNSATITSTWLDAEVIAVSGDVVRFDGISQVNVLIDHDSVSEHIAPADIADQTSTVMNAAAIATKTVREVIEDPAPTGSFDNAPANWAVVHYDGPVVQINWITQHNFTTDFDQASVTVGGSGTYLGLGENKLSNDLDAFELGYEYDLILVGGDLIDINLISQLNVVLDSDVVDAGSDIAPTEAEESGIEYASAKSTENGAAEDGEAYEENELSGVVFDETNDLDLGSEADSEDDKTEVVAEAPVSTGDNLLHNQAAIQTTGLDTDVAITENFEGALDDFANGAAAPSEDVLEDDLFDGTELLRVLYVDGDFTTVNILDQTNILGDADQVHIARDTFSDALQSQIQVTTGSNIAANTAGIQDNGIDSTVMAQGDTYSDALLHQANLVDNDLSDLGQSISDLANEAVAFLVDDIAPPDLGTDIGATANAMVNDTIGQIDIMQTMLA